MTKLLLTGLAFSLFFSSCSSDENDTTPPAIQSESGQLISVFDTLEVQFNEDLTSFDTSNFSSEFPLQYSWDISKPSKVLFYGDSNFLKLRSPSGDTVPILASNIEYSLLLINLSDKESNKTPSPLPFTFKTMPFLDSDYINEGNNDHSKSADTLLTNGLTFLKTPTTQGLSIAGILVGSLNELNAKHDREDFYLIQVKKSDSLQIDLSKFSVDLDIQISGPTPIIPNSKDDVTGGLKTDLLNNSGLKPESFLLIANAERHDVGLAETDLVGKYLNYWVRVFYKDLNESPLPHTPYVLSIKKINQ